MPPIRQLDEAFLFHLLNRDENIKDSVLNNNIDSESLSNVLTKLTSTFNAYEKELFQQVHDNFDEFSTSYNTSQDLHSRVFELVKQVNSTKEQVDKTEHTASSTIDEYQQTLNTSQLNQHKIDALEKLEQILTIIEMIHTELKTSSYLKAVDHILELTRILKVWNADNRVNGLVQGKVGQLKQTLILQLQEDIRTSIQYNLGSMRILETFKPNPTSTSTVHLQEVFQCLDKLGLLAEEMMGIQRLIFKNILGPYFDQSKSYLQVDHVQVDELGSGGVLQVINNSNAEDKLDPISMLQQVDSILAFLYKYMFNSSKETQMNHLFGNLLLPELEDMMILEGIAPAIPSSKYNLSDFDQVTHAVSTFEDKCKTTYGFQIADCTLGLYVKNIDKHYAKKRREKILQEGRKAMIRKLYDAEMTQVKDDGHIYRYQITQTPQILSVLVSDTLEEASELLKFHPISASTLIEGIQDLLDMYRAIMPSYHRPQYLSGPASSLVFRNDCFWLSNQLKLDVAGKSATQHFDGLVKILNMASERLAELGKAWYELTMMHRIQMAQTSLDGLDGFLGMADNSKFQHDCDHAIAQVIELVGSFSTETQPVVDETLFLDMLGRIVDSILSRLIHDIEELVDIGAEESHVIARNLNSLAQLVGAFDLPGRDATESFVSELVPSWEKFWLVKDILEMNMRDIMEYYRKGNLHMFEKSELEGLLCSLFADTELRSSNIQEIKTGVSSQKIAEPVLSPSPSPTHISSTLITRSLTPTATPVNTALNYTPDDDMEATGWGDDDDDLFAEEPTKSSVPEAKPTTISLEPSPSLGLDVDMDMDENSGGWGDADEDLFDEEVTVPEIPDKKSISNDNIVKNETPSTTEANSTSKAISKAPSLDIQGIDEEIDNELNEGEGWGWDDDDDLFKGNDLK